MLPLGFVDNEPLGGYEYWQSYPEYPVEDWIYAIENNETRLGYWEWVKDCMFCDDESRTQEE